MFQWDKIYKKEGKKYGYYDIFKPHEDMPNVLTIFKKQKVKRVLNLGCGAGRNLVYLLEKGFDMYGIDCAPEGLRIIKERLKKEKRKCNLNLGNIFNKLPYEDNFFDAVISVQVLQHGKISEIKRAIKEIERVLKPGGLIFITLSGRISKGRVRPYLIKTAKKIAPRTYVPTMGNEKGLTHFIYNKKLIKKHYHNFKILKIWKDSRDYYCFIAQNKNKA
ncbi:MAG: class I SAM-dependent methyltransferase [Nanoarchaeota archaeon]|nr:class I SAM-dependent methyltransferase [Nanoarchaeota archaeon]MBU4283730.1 class I SAM-dependent methyltransferase [Nanoarchaeota archaeon]